MNNTSFTISNCRVVREPKTFGEGKNAVTIVEVAVNPIGQKAKDKYLTSYYEVRCGGIFATRAAELSKGDLINTIVGPLAEYTYKAKDGKDVTKKTIPFPTVFATPFKEKAESEDGPGFDVGEDTPDPFGLG